MFLDLLQTGFVRVRWVTEGTKQRKQNKPFPQRRSGGEKECSWPPVGTGLAWRDPTASLRRKRLPAGWPCPSPHRSPRQQNPNSRRSPTGRREPAGALGQRCGLFSVVWTLERGKGNRLQKCAGRRSGGGARLKCSRRARLEGWEEERRRGWRPLLRSVCRVAVAPRQPALSIQGSEGGGGGGS